ncbi:MAG: oligosaccharide flippase family protein [Phycisphaerales bacterium]|nr:oligosaccharide flippase family protein [Hyphomonadaceae bacterium]
MKPTPLRHRALRGATWAVLGGNGSQALAFIMFVVVSRMVGPEAFGVVAVALLLIEICRAFTSECFATNLIANGPFKRTDFDAGFILAASMSAVTTLALIAAAPFIALLLNTPQLAGVLPMMAPLVAFHALARLYEAELTIRLEFRALAFRSIAAVLIGGGAGIAAAYAGLGVNALVLQQWAGALISLALLALSSRWHPGFAFTREALVSLGRQSAAIAPANLITTLRQSIDGLAVASFSGAAAAGVYNLANRTRLALQLGLSAAIGRVSLPAFAHVKDDPVRLAGAINEAMRLSTVIAFPVFIGVAAVAPELIDVFLGAEWAGAAGPMALLMVGGALAITTRLCENVLLIKGRRAAIVALHAFALALLLGGLALFARYGPLAVAGVVLAGGVLHNIAVWVCTARATPKLATRAYIANVWAPMGISVAMLLLVMAIRGGHAVDGLPGVLRLAAFIAIGALFYIGATWAFARPAFKAALGAARLVLSPTPAKPT